MSTINQFMKFHLLVTSSAIIIFQRIIKAGSLNGIRKKMVHRRTISFILAVLLIFFICTGSHHFFCNCYAQSCRVHTHTNPANYLWIVQPIDITSMGLTHVVLFLSLFEERAAHSTGFFTPLKARAPPHE
jgi:hypothetical protein